jgi:hypothetical protein
MSVATSMKLVSIAVTRTSVAEPVMKRAAESLQRLAASASIAYVATPPAARASGHSTAPWTSRDATRDISMTLYNYPQPVLNPQLEQV